MRTLGLCFNDLRSLPKELVKLKKLDTLDISFNHNLKIADQLEILNQMQWLKYINIIETNFEETTIYQLRLGLPKTKIAAKLEDLEIETLETSQ